MNVDLLKDNPAWTTYFYIAVPLFICVVLSVLLLKAGQQYRRRLWKALRDLLQSGAKAITAWAQVVIQKLRLPSRGRGPIPPQDIEMGLVASATTPDINLAEVALRNGWCEMLISTMKAFDPRARELVLRRVLPTVVEEMEAIGDLDAKNQMLSGFVEIVEQVGHIYNHIGLQDGRLDMRGDLDKVLGKAIPNSNSHGWMHSFDGPLLEI